MRSVVVMVIATICLAGCLGSSAQTDGASDSTVVSMRQFDYCYRSFHDSQGAVYFNATGCSTHLGQLTAEAPSDQWKLENMTTGFAFIIRGDSHANLKSTLKVESTNRTGVTYGFEAELLWGQHDEPDPQPWLEENTEEILFFSSCDKQSLEVEYSTASPSLEPGPRESITIDVVAFQPDPFIAEDALDASTCDGWWGE